MGKDNDHVKCVDYDCVADNASLSHMCRYTLQYTIIMNNYTTYT